jgi:hypothetical protein
MANLKQEDRTGVKFYELRPGNFILIAGYVEVVLATGQDGIQVTHLNKQVRDLFSLGVTILPQPYPIVISELVQFARLSHMANLSFREGERDWFVSTEEDRIYYNYLAYDRISLKKQVRFFHNLQNLHFELTGRELVTN